MQGGGRAIKSAAGSGILLLIIADGIYQELGEAGPLVENLWGFVAKPNDRTIAAQQNGVAVGTFGDDDSFRLLG